MAYTDLITFDEYLALTAQSVADLDATDTARITASITNASTAIRMFCDRNLQIVSDETTGPRQFRFEPGEFLEIDDCTAINSVSTVATPWAISRSLDTSEWFAYAHNRWGIIEHIEFFTRFLATGMSPEMGFKRNLDNYPATPYPVMIEVDAAWGWPEIPDIVKQAAVWTTETFINFRGQSPFNAEAIAGYSRSYNQFQQRGSRSVILLVQALPEQAVAVLEPFMRLSA